MYMLAYTGVGLTPLVYITLGLILVGVGIIKWTKKRMNKK